MKKINLLKIKTIPQYLTLSIFIGIISFIVSMLIFAAILSKYDISNVYVRYSYIFMSVISGFISGSVAGHCSKSKGIICSKDYYTIKRDKRQT